MKRATTPNPACEKASLKVLKLVEKVALQVNGRPVKLSYWQQSTKKPEADTRIKFPVYNRQTDGNVFDWLISTAEDFRKIRQRERYLEFKKATTKPEGVDKPKVED
jgi:hypothetical protein